MTSVDILRSIQQRVEAKGWQVVRHPGQLPNFEPPVVVVLLRRGNVSEVTIGRSSEEMVIEVRAYDEYDGDEPDVRALEMRQELEPVVLGAHATMEFTGYEVDYQGVSDVRLIVGMVMFFRVTFHYQRGNP